MTQCIPTIDLYLLAVSLMTKIKYRVRSDTKETEFLIDEVQLLPDLTQIDRSDIVVARSYLFLRREEAALLKIRELLLRYRHASAVGKPNRPDRYAVKPDM